MFKINSLESTGKIEKDQRKVWDPVKTKEKRLRTKKSQPKTRKHEIKTKPGPKRPLCMLTSACTLPPATHLFKVCEIRLELIPDTEKLNLKPTT